MSATAVAKEKYQKTSEQQQPCRVADRVDQQRLVDIKSVQHGPSRIVAWKAGRQFRFSLPLDPPAEAVPLGAFAVTFRLLLIAHRLMAVAIGLLPVPLGLQAVEPSLVLVAYGLVPIPLRVLLIALVLEAIEYRLLPVADSLLAIPFRLLPIALMPGTIEHRLVLVADGMLAIALRLFPVALGLHPVQPRLVLVANRLFAIADGLFPIPLGLLAVPCRLGFIAIVPVALQEHPAYGPLPPRLRLLRSLCPKGEQSDYRCTQHQSHRKLLLLLYTTEARSG
jgi:hypothetical protein